MPDPLTPYETGLARLLKKLERDSPCYADILTQEVRLRENIASARQYGDTDGLRHTRAQIVDTLNMLALDALEASFNELCELGREAAVLTLAPPSEAKYETRIEQGYGIALGPRSLSPTLQEHTRLLDAYRAHIRACHANLDTRGLVLSQIDDHPLDPSLVRIPLDRVYIKLRAMPHRSHPAEVRPEDDASLARHVREQQERRQKWEQEIRREECVILSPEETVRDCPQLVILGAPGAGKSTFLRHLAWADAVRDGPLPLLVPLGRVDVALTGGRSLLEAALDLLTEHAADRDGLRTALACEIKARRVRLLWDALDEVRVHRRAVLDGLSGLQAGGLPMVITSRFWGYAPLPGLDALYEVLPLQPDDARAFIDRWFQALAEAREDIPPAERSTWEKERRTWMETQLKKQPGLRETARNPLMLTFLAVLAGDDPRRDFPRHRRDLYARFVERLVLSWEAWRLGGEEVPLLTGFGDPHEAREAALWGFRRLALRLHLAYAGQPAQATRPAAKDALAREIGRETGISRLSAQARAEAALDFWQRAGLLDRYSLGGKAYLAFRHLTFQEYGASCALVEEYEGDPEGLWTELEPHVLEKEWTEVISLALAHLTDAAPWLAQLLVANARDEDRQRPLFLAAASLADGARAEEAMRRRVVDGLERLARAQSVRRQEKASASDALAALGRLERDSYAAQRLLALAKDKGVNALARKEAAESLGELGRADEAVPILLALAQDGEVNALVRVLAAKSLGELGRADEATFILLSLVRDEGVEAWVHVVVAWALGQLGRGDELLSLARDEEVDVQVRVQAAESLGKLGHADKATSILLILAHDEKVDIQMRVHAAESLGKLGRADEAASVLLILVHDEEVDVQVRVQAAKSLGKLGRSDDLLALACDAAVDRQVRVQAAESLGEQGRTDEVAQAWLALARYAGVNVAVGLQAIESLVKLNRPDKLLLLAHDPGVIASIRVRTAESLGALGHANEVVPTLLALARDVALNEKLRVRVAKTLERLGHTEELLALARDAEVDTQVRMQIAGALGKLNRTDEATCILLDLACNAKAGAWLRYQAARSLGELGSTDEASQAWLALSRDAGAEAGWRALAAMSLRDMGRDDEASQAWLNMAQDTGGEMRMRVLAAMSLGELGHTEDAVPILLALARDTKAEMEVRVQAAESLGKLDYTEDAVPILLALARDTGVEVKVRMQAAKSLGKLGRADETIPILLALARGKGGDVEIRERAAKLLGELGHADESADAWLSLTRDEGLEAQVRLRAADTLGELGRADDLLSLVQEKGVDVWVRMTAVWALGELSRADEAARTLLALAQDEELEPWLHALVAETLTRLGRTDEATTPGADPAEGC